MVAPITPDPSTAARSIRGNLGFAPVVSTMLARLRERVDSEITILCNARTKHDAARRRFIYLYCHEFLSIVFPGKRRALYRLSH
jgi:hypothetical protein